MRTVLRHMAAALAVTALSIATLATIGISPAQAVSVELKDVAADRIERQRQAAAGKLPLAGTPDLESFTERMRAKGFSIGTPMMIRVFKAESELEVWMQRGDRFELFATYPICYWSGQLGPKLEEGDRQTPEGFYTVTRRLLHRRGRWPRSLNLGFPNAFDKALTRTGSYILVHGGCSSIGCFAMTNAVMNEVYKLTSSAIYAGQRYVPVHVFPFHMTEENLKVYADSRWQTFWQNLKEGYDAFERTRRPPHVNVCNGRYHFRDGIPPEVGDPGPLGMCDTTVAQTAALEQYAATVPNRKKWQALSLLKRKQLSNAFRQARRYDVAMGAPRIKGVRNAKRGVRTQNARTQSPNAPSASAQVLRVKFECNWARPSCRRFVALKRKRLKWQASQKAKSRRASSRKSRTSKRVRTAKRR